MPIHHPYNRYYGPVTFTGFTTFSGEILCQDTVYMVQADANPALKLTGANNVSNTVYMEDFFANPLFVFPTTGGDAMLGDRRRSFRPGDVTDPDFQVLTSTADNVATNAGGLNIGHGTGHIQIYTGIGAPGAAHPVTSGIPANGTFYFRSDGGAGTTVYQVRAGAWVGIV